MLIRGSKPVDSALPGDFKSRYSRTGSVFILVVVCMVVLAALGVGMLTVSWGARRNAIMLKSEATAMLAAEAGYEKAVYWMSQQPDMLSALEAGASGTAGSLSFPDSRCNYQIKVYTFLGSRPIYQVISNGYSGVFCRTVDVYVVQAISGWDMGMCRVPYGTSSTYPVNFMDGEIIDMPIQINNLKDSPDNRDIYIIGSPQFKQLVSMGEPRYTSGGTDKYASVMGLFEQGIYFSQPESRITDEAVVQSKVDRFIENTKDEFKFIPVSSYKPSASWDSAVHLEFFIEGGVGKVRITNNCPVRGYMRSGSTWDYRVKEGSGGGVYEKYYIYAYHMMPGDADTSGDRYVVPLSDTYVTQSYGEYESEPGGQIYVAGNVIIASGDPNLPNQDTIKGTVTVVATGNIWIADSIVVDGPHKADDGKPSPDNPNVLGLMAQGVVKVVDPGLSARYKDEKAGIPSDLKYVPIGRPDKSEADPAYREYERHLPDPTEIEAAITIGGGGWGAENVAVSGSGSDPGRKEWPLCASCQDTLRVCGTLVEAIRAVVGIKFGTSYKDGYLKQYYFDERLLEGILPANIWLRGKYVPAPAGWHDYRSSI